MKINFNSKPFKTLIPYFVVFGTCFARFIYYGFSYFPQLDDYIQYHNYPLSPNYSLLIKQLGLLSSRPLAGIFDLYVWVKLWGCMILAILIISLLWAGSALLFKSVFSKYFGCSHFFTVIYALLPLGFEGTYWLSASTRIVCGMFFTSLALWIFQLFLEKRKKLLLPLWMIVQLISFCYYEQIAVLSVIITLAIVIYMLIKKKLYSLWGLLTIADVAGYFAFTAAFSGGNLSNRMELIFPTSKYYFEVFLPDITRQIGAAFIKGGYLTLFKGFIRGIKIIIDDFAWLYILFLIAAGVLFYFMCKKQLPEKKDKSSVIIGLIFALIIIFAPILPFLFIDNPWFSLRATVPAFAGIALFADIIIRLIFKNSRKVIPIITAVIAVVFCVSAVSELHDYKETNKNDLSVIDMYIDATYGKQCGRTGILNLNPSNLEDQNYFYHEHIHGVIESDWAFNGAVNAKLYDSGKMLDSEPVPLATNGFSYSVTWNKEAKKISGFDTLFWYNGDELIPVFATGSDSDGWEITDSNGMRYAFIWEEDIYTYIDIFV